MANRYWVGGSATWDATAGTKWATASGGAGGAAVPTASDDVFFDANSGSVTVTVSGTRVGLSLNCTGFTGTLDGSGSLTISGNVTFVAGMTLNITGALLQNANGTLTSGGKVWAGSITMGNGVTHTLADNWVVTGDLTRAAGTTTTTLNGNSLTINGNFTWGNTTPNLLGTTLVILNGVGKTISSSMVSARVGVSLTISSSASYSLLTNFRYGGSGVGGTLTIESGATFNTANFELNIVTGNVVIDANGHTIDKLHIETAGLTVSLASSLLVSANFNASAATAASPIIFNSTSPGTQRTFTLLSGATQLVNFVNATDIDSSAGQTIIDWRGTLSNTVNWNALAGALQTVAYIF